VPVEQRRREAATGNREEKKRTKALSKSLAHATWLFFYKNKRTK
jgi:hypothetical protein